jgi:hypothetical protein
MKKKAYITPSTCIVACLSVGPMLQTVSGVTSNEKEIPYGGIDEEGELTPGARQRYDAWDDWDDEEEE